MKAQCLVWVVGNTLAQCFALIEEEFIGQLCIAHRIVARGRAKLVVFDQPVIRVLREGNRRQFERIDQREPVKSQPGMQHLKSRLVERDNVVSEDESRALGDCIKPLDEILGFSGDLGSRIGIWPVSTDLAQDRLILAGRLNVNAQALCSCRFLGSRSVFCAFHPVILCA